MPSHEPNVTDPETLWFPFGMGPAAARHRLFCLPFAGGGASFFLPWRKALAQHGVVPIQYPGRETRLHEPCYTNLDALVDALSQVIRPHLDRPYSLLGYSLGARVAYALCHRLAELGAPGPELFIAAAHHAPDAPPTMPGAHWLPDDAFNQQMRQYGGLPEVVFQDPELSSLLLPILRQDIRLVEDAVPQTPLATPILAYAGDSDASATPGSMKAWSKFTRIGFGLRVFSGGHFFARTAGDFLTTLRADISSC